MVSLCLLGQTQIPTGVSHVGYRLIDHSDAAVNPNPCHMIVDAARTIATLRDEGHEGLVHCVAARSRTPTVGAAHPDPGFRGAPKRLELLGLRD